MRVELGSIKEMSDRTLHACPLGVRFRDDVLQTVISDGLKVTAYSAESPGLRIEAISNPSGVYVFHGLPGLHAFEFRQGQKPWEDLHPWPAYSYKPFCIEVRDTQRRFLPFLLRVQVPHQGVVAWTQNAAVSPPAAGDDCVRLYSAPTRKTPPGLAVLRSELWDKENNRPAARAQLEASYKGQPLARGFADDSGRIVLFFPYPEPARIQLSSLAGSPPRTPGIVPLRNQEWRIDLRLFYGQAASLNEMPDLATVCGQPPASMWQDQDLQSELTHTSLEFEKESTLRTKAGSAVLPVLYITSAVSPP